jgi:hypothetical protein
MDLMLISGSLFSLEVLRVNTKGDSEVLLSPDWTSLSGKSEEDMRNPKEMAKTGKCSEPATAGSRLAKLREA